VHGDEHENRRGDEARDQESEKKSGVAEVRYAAEDRRGWDGDSWLRSGRRFGFGYGN